ncbi:MAG: hypothetical protein K6B75_06035 [Lachnospiraceae bacterium]|nr:hypothetical protein [Lachnospiraceae bacterium]
MGRIRHYKKQEVLTAIENSHGIVTNVAKRLKCNWHTADAFIKKWPETIKAFEDETEAYLDLTESACIDRIKQGDGQMIRFVLATKGKKRGYGTEDTPADTAGADTEVNISVTGGEPEPVEVGKDETV